MFNETNYKNANGTLIFDDPNFSVLCYAFPQKVYLDASDNIVISKNLSNIINVAEVPNQSWINGGITKHISPSTTPLSMSVNSNTTGLVRTGTITIFDNSFTVV